MTDREDVLAIRGDELEAVIRYLHEFAAKYPADVFPSHAEGGDITGNAGAAARHVLTTAANELAQGPAVQLDLLGGAA